MTDFQRRTFLIAAGTMMVAPLLGNAQSNKNLPRVGFLSPVSPGKRDKAFISGMQALGWTPGDTVNIDLRFAEGRPERLSVLVDELLALKPDVLLTGSTIGTKAAIRSGTSLPIVFAGSSDPVAGGLVKNLRRPGGNITGFSLAYGDGFAGKWPQLLKEAIPELQHVALIWSSSNPAARRFVEEVKSAAAKLGLKLDVYHAKDRPELDAALTSVADSGAGGLIVAPSPFAASQRKLFVAFSKRHRQPAIYFSESFPNAGGLMSYGPDIPDVYRRAAAHVDRILKGATPGELPVERPTKFNLVVNLSAAEAIGVTIPHALLLRANRVIE